MKQQKIELPRGLVLAHQRRSHNDSVGEDLGRGLFKAWSSNFRYVCRPDSLKRLW